VGEAADELGVRRGAEVVEVDVAVPRGDEQAVRVAGETNGGDDVGRGGGEVVLSCGWGDMG
jgi:hypothetical protein